MGGDMAARRCPSHRCRFNPRPRMGGDQRKWATDPDYLPFQSTPPHGGRPSAPHHDGTAPLVSIHAPAWGATWRECDATPPPGFNPRPRMGGDWAAPETVYIQTSFNPRPRMGGDENEPLEAKRWEWFQSTPPHGGRLFTPFQ